VTHEEILQLLHDETLVGNGPAVSDGPTRGSTAVWNLSGCSTTRCYGRSRRSAPPFEPGDDVVLEMLIAARAMQCALDIPRPLLAETGIAQIGLCRAQVPA
jgi:hypothetical protein